MSAVYGGSALALVSTYDSLNRLSTLTEAGSVTAYSYDLNGNNTGKVLPNGDTVATAYDALNRSTSITGTKTGGATHYQYSQTRDAVGNVTAISETTANLPARTLSMTYDDVYRLLSQVETVGGQTNTTSYTYDHANNRATRTKVTSAGTSVASYGYNAANRLISVTEGTRAQVFDYDAAGNRTVRGENGLDNAFYSYDFENRLVWLAQPGHAYNYIYDYRTRRVERMEDGIATKVIFSGGTSVREVTASAPTVEYVRGSDWGGGVGGILYTLRGGTPSFTHYDSRGDVTTKTDGSGLVTYQASYEAFGTRTQEHGATADRQKANTKEEDPTGLLNEGMRYRDLDTGTFLTADPAGFVDGPNLYAYVRQNPWTSFDPDGLAEKEKDKPAPKATPFPEKPERVIGRNPVTGNDIVKPGSDPKRPFPSARDAAIAAAKAMKDLNRRYYEYGTNIYREMDGNVLKGYTYGPIERGPRVPSMQKQFGENKTPEINLHPGSKLQKMAGSIHSTRQTSWIGPIMATVIMLE